MLRCGRSGGSINTESLSQHPGLRSTPMRSPRQRSSLGFRTLSIRVLLAFALALELGLAESPTSEGVDEEVDALVQEFRDLPKAPLCEYTPCNQVSKAWADRRRQISDRFHELGSAAVPQLARMLESSLQGSDHDLPNTILYILDVLSTGPYFSADGKQHEKNDISAALPVLILALDDPHARSRAANGIRVIGPKAAEAVPKLVALLDDANWMVRDDGCNGLRGIDPLPALRRARSDPNPGKRQFAQRAVANIETKCWGVEVSGTDAAAEIHEGSSCDAPPYRDTPAAYKAFVQPYVSFALRPAKRFLQDVCHYKFLSPRSLLPPGWSVEEVDTHGTVALAERRLAKLVKMPERWQQFERGGDSPADLFLCLQPDGSCRQIQATVSTPINSLFECQSLASFLSDGGPPSPQSPEGRFVVPGAGVWYECRSKYLGTWEPQIPYRLDQADAVWMQINASFPFYVDTSSVTLHGDIRRAWFKVASPHHSWRWDDGIKYVAEWDSMWEFRCSSKDLRILGSNWSFEDGSAQQGWVTFEWSPLQFQPGRPEDLAENYLCKLPPKPSLAPKWGWCGFACP